MPDLSAILSTPEIVGAVQKQGDILVYEATVYPGAVEEDCVPVLEKTSGLSLEANFSI
jgi:UDP-N-acetyl-D-galactosamine dehydrogenase